MVKKRIKVRYYTDDEKQRKADRLLTKRNPDRMIRRLAERGIAAYCRMLEAKLRGAK